MSIQNTRQNQPQDAFTAATHTTATEAPNPRYRTRYGIRTASEAALELIDRARFRVEFIGMMFKACGQEGYDVSIPGYEACGLAYILEDVGYDLQEAYGYYFGDDTTPGKLNNLHGGRHE